MSFSLVGQQRWGRGCAMGAVAVSIYHQVCRQTAVLPGGLLFRPLPASECEKLR